MCVKSRSPSVLLKIESVINGRPLAYFSEDDLGDVLTPNHLMYGRNIRKKSNVTATGFEPTTT